MQYFSKSCTLFQVWNDLKRETNGARNKLDLIRKIVNWWKTKENDLVYPAGIVYKIKNYFKK
jgi:hypothetical protein